MLSSLKIENVAVIEKAEILFGRGLNILTGETGAGKSIVIDSINAILGERTSRELIRDGADKAKVTAVFDDVPIAVLQKLYEYDIDCDDNSLLISRVISLDGRNICKINGQTVTVSMLKNIGRELITICGQHDSQHLLLKEKHLDYIDSIADCSEYFHSYSEVFSQIKAVRKQLKSLIKNEGDKERKLEYLKFQIDERTNANIKAGDREALTEEKKKYQNKEKILQNLDLCRSILSGDGDSAGVLASIDALSASLKELSLYDSRFSSSISAINELRYSLEDCSGEINSSLNDIEDNDIDINAIEERLDVLYRLSKKYGETEEEMLSYLEKITEEYDDINLGNEKAELLQEKYDELSEDLFNKGCILSDCRKQAASDFEEKVTEDLHYLDMPGACFTAEFSDAPATVTGIDDVEFLFSANPGQEPKPLIKIASGGELSRVMLAIRCVLSDNDDISSMVFDEIDTGVSGRAALKIAYKLHELSKSKQVLCVTHLAQIAAYADNHLYIEKTVEEGRTYTKVTELSFDDRIREIARIIGGDIITQTTLSSAKEMIDFAKDETNYL
ncbi:MAG: DNA repair protein RecN [Clostridia bacterium]|nr:DNA repair protein RecN [Clostridia bacterium]